MSCLALFDAITQRAYFEPTFPASSSIGGLLIIFVDGNIVINENGSILLEPVLEIDSCEVDAEHFATIGTFSDDELFYLQSKGLSLDAAYILLKRHFLYSLFSKNFINLIEGRDENE